MEKMRPPNRSKRIGPRTRTEKVVLACVITTGEIKEWPAKRLPLKIALPTTAAAPQQNVAVATKKYPRHGCCRSGAGLTGCWAADSLGKHCVQALRIKADHDFFPDDNGWRGTAVVGTHQLKNRLLVRTHVFH